MYVWYMMSGIKNKPKNYLIRAIYMLDEYILPVAKLVIMQIATCTDFLKLIIS